MGKTFKELSNGVSLNNREMFTLKGGFIAKAYGCKSSFCADAQYTCKNNMDEEIDKFCSTAICKEMSMVPPTPPSICDTMTYVIIQPPKWCTTAIR